MDILWIVVIGVFVVTAVSCAGIAGTKGRSVVGWGIAGLLFGLIALVVLIALPNLRDLAAAQMVVNMQLAEQQQRLLRIATLLDQRMDQLERSLPALKPDAALPARETFTALAIGTFVKDNVVSERPAAEWYLKIGNEQYGPLLASTFATLIERGVVVSTTWVWAKHMEFWQEASMVPELASIFAARRAQSN